MAVSQLEQSSGTAKSVYLGPNREHVSGLDGDFEIEWIACAGRR